MTVREKAQSLSTTRRQQAEQRLLVIRNALEVADVELERAFVERDWETLEFDSWESYCAAIPEFQHFKMKAGPRRVRAKLLREAGATIPEIVAATGSSLGTIHRDLNPAPSFQMETAQPAEMPAEPSSPTAPTHVLAARVIAACGASGGTTREVMGHLKWDQGPASVALSKAAKKKLVVPTGERRHVTTNSIGFTVYRIAL